jgi:hypothetical protein
MRGGPKSASPQVAVQEFEKITSELPEWLDVLLESVPFHRGNQPAAPHIPGVYLFTEDGVHRYVGRTRNANRRLGEHTRPSSTQNSAPFAFNVAKAEAIKAGVKINGTRQQISSTSAFVPHFVAAKQRVRAMDFRILGISDPVRSTLFEVYAAVALSTEGGFNLFETH